MQKKRGLKLHISKPGVLLHGDRPYLAARPHYFVDFVDAAAPRAILLIRPCRGEPPKVLAAMEEKQVWSRPIRAGPASALSARVAPV